MQQVQQPTCKRVFLAAHDHSWKGEEANMVDYERKVTLANEKLIGNGSFGVVFQVRDDDDALLLTEKMLDQHQPNPTALG